MGLGRQRPPFSLLLSKGLPDFISGLNSLQQDKTQFLVDS